jgi:hypothetical protein
VQIVLSLQRIHSCEYRYIQNSDCAKRDGQTSPSRRTYTRFAFCIRFTSTLQPFQYCNKHMVSFPLTYLTSFLQWHPDRIVMRIVCAAADSLSVSRHFYPRTLTLLFIFGNFQRNKFFIVLAKSFVAWNFFTNGEIGNMKSKVKVRSWKSTSSYALWPLVALVTLVTLVKHRLSFHSYALLKNWWCTNRTV